MSFSTLVALAQGVGWREGDTLVNEANLKIERETSSLSAKDAQCLGDGERYFFQNNFPCRLLLARWYFRRGGDRGAENCELRSGNFKGVTFRISGD